MTRVSTCRRAHKVLRHEHTGECLSYLRTTPASQVNCVCLFSWNCHLPRSDQSRLWHVGSCLHLYLKPEMDDIAIARKRDVDIVEPRL